MKGQVFNNCVTVDTIGKTGIEPVKSCSGAWYDFSKHDLEIFISDTKNLLKNYISPDEKIALFLDLDNARFLSIVIYQACIACGAIVIRCGISDFDRQLPIQNNISADWIVCSNTLYKHIKNKINHKKKMMIFNEVEFDTKHTNNSDIDIFELYNLPIFIVRTGFKVLIPGYVKSNAEKQAFIKNKGIENTQLPKEICHKSIVDEGIIVNDISVTVNFIKLYVDVFIQEHFNGYVNQIDDSIIINSIGMIELIVKIEEEFGIILPIEKLSKEQIENSRLLSELILSIIVGE